MKEQFLHNFEEYVSKGNLCDTKLRFEIDIAEQFKIKSGVVLAFDMLAYIKMTALVHECEKEVALNGTVTRDGDGFFTVHDMFFYPQEVTGATVEATDDYATWLMNLDDEVFNHLRFQMHSHVNMATHPSATDDNYYKTMLTNIRDFYIFMIVNKRHEVFVNIYDIENNVLYEHKDIDIFIKLNDNEYVEDWVGTGLKDFVKEKKIITMPPVGEPLKINSLDTAKNTGTTTATADGTGKNPDAAKKNWRRKSFDCTARARARRQ